MFGGRFSLTKFSLRGDVEPDAPINVFFIEMLDNLIAIRQNASAENHFRCRINNQTILTRGWRFRHNFREGINAEIAGVREFEIRTKYRERCRSELIPANANTAIENIFNEIINVNLGAGIDFQYAAEFKEEFDTLIKAWNDFSIDLGFTEAVTANIIPSIFISLMANFREMIETEIYPANNVIIDNNFAEQVLVEIAFGGNFPAGRIDFREIVTALVWLSKDVPMEVDFTESVFMTSLADLVEKDTLTITVNIPINGELRIDSETFTVLLNNQNILHNHSGDWINLNRDSLDLSINSSRTLNGELIYVERFLYSHIREKCPIVILSKAKNLWCKTLRSCFGSQTFFNLYYYNA
ncbi:MAG: hypothetical protein FWF15_03465 [Oscillospiraceae bacterium]|nr:hypothetical protein [Oscillospiraceae bacterium]